jgi:hypothetical protein
LSPDDRWAAFFAVENSAGIKVVSVGGQKAWGIFFADITDYDCGPCGEAWVEIEHWSQDGRYLYVSPFTGGDGGGNDWFWGKDIKLIRFNLENGTWVDTGKGNAFSFSPNDRYLAYRVDSQIRIFEFRTGSETIFILPTETVDFGKFVWSPDSKELILSTLTVNLDYEKPMQSKIYLINLADVSMKPLIESDELFLYPIKWEESNVVHLLAGYYEKTPYIYDFETGVLAPVSP